MSITCDIPGQYGSLDCRSTARLESTTLNVQHLAATEQQPHLETQLACTILGASASSIHTSALVLCYSLTEILLPCLVKIMSY